MNFNERQVFHGLLTFQNPLETFMAQCHLPQPNCYFKHQLKVGVFVSAAFIVTILSQLGAWCS